MTHYPQDASALAAASAPTGSTYDLTITSSVTSNAKGSYTQVFASTSFTANRLNIRGRTRAASTAFLVDLALGAAGAETVLIPNTIWESYTGSSHYGQAWFDVPAAVPSGSRIALRCQSSVGSSTTVVLAVSIFAAGDTPGIDTWNTYGANTGTSLGTAVDPGGAANTKGSYAQLTSSSAALTQALLLMTTTNCNQATTAARWNVDIATGAGGAEAVLFPDLYMGVNTDSGAAAFGANHASPMFLTYIPASTRIAVRSQSDLTDATDRVLGMAILAGTGPDESASSGSAATAVPFIGFTQ